MDGVGEEPSADDDKAARRYRALLWALFAVAAVLRLHDLFAPFGSGEANQANLLSRASTLAAFNEYPGNLRPLLYQLIVKGGVEVFGNATWVYRLPSLLASLALLPVAATFLRRVSGSRVATLYGVFLLAVNPSVLMHSWEFRPYVLDLLVAFALIAVGVAWAERRTRARDLLLASLILAGPLLAYPVVLVLPALVLPLAVDVVRSRHLLRIVGAYGVLLFSGALTIGQYVLKTTHDRARSHFGYMDRRFYDGLPEPLRWLEDTRDLLGQLPTARVDGAWLVDQLIVLSHAGLAIAGIVILARSRRLRLLAILVAPLLLLTLLSVLGKWPNGAERMNLFAIACVLPLIVIGVAALLRRVPTRAALVVVGLFVALQLPSSKNQIRTGAGPVDARGAMADLIAETTDARIGVSLSEEIAPLFYYYSRHNSAERERFGAWGNALLRQRRLRIGARNASAVSVAETYRADIASHGEVWIVVVEGEHEQADALLALTASEFEVTEGRNYRGVLALRLRAAQ